MVGRTASYSAYFPYTKNKADASYKAMQQDSVAFKGNYLKEMPNIMNAANEVLSKMKGSMLEVHVPRFKTKCIAKQGYTSGVESLCICFENKGKAIRYRIGLNEDNQVSPLSELVKEKLSSREAFFAEDSLPIDESSIAELQMILDTLIGRKNKYKPIQYPLFPPFSVKHPEVVVARR